MVQSDAEFAVRGPAAHDISLADEMAGGSPSRLHLGMAKETRRRDWVLGWNRLSGLDVRSSAEFARRSGLCGRTAYLWMTGRRNATGRAVLRVSRRLGVSGEALLLALEAAQERRARALEAERVRKAAE